MRSIIIDSGITLDSNNCLGTAAEPQPSAVKIKVLLEQETQTDGDKSSSVEVEVKVKEEILEPKPSPPRLPVKTEDCSDSDSSAGSNAVLSDASEDLSLFSLKEIKRKENGNAPKNGQVEENKRGRKRKGKLKDLEILINSLNTNSALTVLKKKDRNIIAEEEDSKTEKIKSDPGKRNKKSKKEEQPQDVYQCCICFNKFYTRADILHHYRSLPFDCNSILLH